MLGHPIRFTFFMLFSFSFGKLNVKWLFIQTQWQKQILANTYWAKVNILCLYMDFVRLEPLIHTLTTNYHDYYTRNNIHWKSSCANEHNKHRVLYFMGYYWSRFSGRIFYIVHSEHRISRRYHFIYIWCELHKRCKEK